MREIKLIPWSAVKKRKKTDRVARPLNYGLISFVGGKWGGLFIIGFRWAAAQAEQFGSGLPQIAYHQAVALGRANRPFWVGVKRWIDEIA